MLRTLFRFALPGGRRVFVVYLPPETLSDPKIVPPDDPVPPKFDQIFAQAGIYTNAVWIPERPRGKRTR